MEAGREEAEWWRVSHLEAWVANRLRFSKGDPVIHPKDINPFYKANLPPEQPTDAKQMMNGFFARHQEIPVQRMKLQEDGTWIEVKEPKEAANGSQEGIKVS